MKLDAGNLKIEPVGKTDLFLFSFLQFRFFYNSPNGQAIPLIGNPAWLGPFIIIPFMLAAFVHVRNFGAAKYFIKDRDEVAGTLILKVDSDMLSVRGLAVSPSKRRRGVGFFALVETEKLAKQLKLSWLELDVLKGNVSAQGLYWKFGFRVHSMGKLTVVLRKRV